MMRRRRSRNDCIYEIYPQSETPQLTKIALIDNTHLDVVDGYLLPDKLIWFNLDTDKIIFRVWDYRLNASVSFTSICGNSIATSKYYIFPSLGSTVMELILNYRCVLHRQLLLF